MVGIRKRFGATLALDGVGLAVAPGEILALVGENGAGKSTLMKVLSGVHEADEGEMLLNGKPFLPRCPLDARKAGVSMIYQELSLAKDVSVAENILIGNEPRHGLFLDWKALRKQAASALAEVGHEDLSLDAPAGKLSVAQQQLVEIARAIAVGSQVLVLDEPTSSLERADVISLFKLLKRLKSQGKAIIYISHFLEEVREISDRYVVLRDGRSVGGGSTATATEEQIISMMVGRDVADLYPRSPRTPGTPVLNLEGIGGSPKPAKASLTLHRGEVVGIAGVVGAGRTELLRAVFGLDAVRCGAITVVTNQQECTDHGASTSKRWAGGIGMVSEDRKSEGLALEMSIADNLTFTRLPRFLNPEAVSGESVKWADKMSVRYRNVDQKVGDLSGGNQQKVAIGRLLYHDADVLFLDEPTRGIDVGSKAQIYETIDALATAGKAVLVVSSYLPELLGICDRIAVMCRGVLGEARPVGELDEQEIMRQATGVVEVKA